jgi:hypothetical protein
MRAHACTRVRTPAHPYIHPALSGLQLIDVFLQQSQKQRMFLAVGNSVHKWMFVATVAEKAYVLDQRPEVSLSERASERVSEFATAHRVSESVSEQKEGNQLTFLLLLLLRLLLRFTGGWCGVLLCGVLVGWLSSSSERWCVE